MRSLILLLLIFSASVATAIGQTKNTEPSPDRPLKIIDKPEASYPDGSICAQGSVTLRVTFDKSGEIGSVSVVKGGHAVTVTRPVSFSFTIY